MAEALLIIGAYVVGSFPTGVLVGHLFGFDPRAVGSGNIGMTNVARAGGGRAAAITFVGDVLKGAIPVIVARGAGFDVATIAWTGLAAFVGSICSVFLRFRGGKGISAALGIWLVIAPMVMVFALMVFAIVVALSRIVSLASISAAIALPIVVVAMGLPRGDLLLAIVMPALVLIRFHENIQRLLRGEEPKFKVKPRDAATA